MGAGAYRRSHRCLRHSISAVGPKIPSTEAVKTARAGPFTSRQTSSHRISWMFRRSSAAVSPLCTDGRIRRHHCLQNTRVNDTFCRWQLASFQRVNETRPNATWNTPMIPGTGAGGSAVMIRAKSPGVECCYGRKPSQKVLSADPPDTDLFVRWCGRGGVARHPRALRPSLTAASGIRSLTSARAWPKCAGACGDAC